MKKIFTLLVGAAMLAPMASAEDIKMSVFEMVGTSMDTYAPGDLKGYITSTVTYDETTKSYTIKNFLGYDKADVTFRVASATDVTEYDCNIEMNGVLREAVIFDVAKDAPTATNITKYANAAGTKLDFELPYELTEHGLPDPESDGYRTATIEGVDESYQLANVSVWGSSVKSIENPNINPLNITKRTYAVKQGSGYKFYFQLNPVAQWVNSGAGWTFEDYPIPNSYLVFSYPDNGGSSAITEIEAADDNAPVEYFNLQGVRVDNPANGLYIRRQGNKIEKVVIR